MFLFAIRKQNVPKNPNMILKLVAVLKTLKFITFFFFTQQSKIKK